MIKQVIAARRRPDFGQEEFNECRLGVVIPRA